MTELPNTLHALLDVTLEDFAKCEADPRYVIGMDVWHMGGNLCEVCLAGSRMAQSLGASLGSFLSPSSFTLDECRRLRALDWLRCGSVGMALVAAEGVVLSLDTKRHALDRDVAEYDEDPGQWWDDMRELLADLRKAAM